MIPYARYTLLCDFGMKAFMVGSYVCEAKHRLKRPVNLVALGL